VSHPIIANPTPKKHEEKNCGKRKINLSSLSFKFLPSSFHFTTFLFLPISVNYFLGFVEALSIG
jgi:hypothetical protein